MKTLLSVSILFVSFHAPLALANDDSSSNSKSLCLYAGHYQEMQNGRCPTPPQGSCEQGQVECNRLLYSSGCVPASSNFVGTTRQCTTQLGLSSANTPEANAKRDRQAAYFKQIKETKAAEFAAIHALARKYFEQERDKQPNVTSRSKASLANVEADEAYTRYLNLEQIVKLSTSQPSAMSQAQPSAATEAECVGPTESDFQSCNSEVRTAVTEELSGACQLLLIEADSLRAKKAKLKTFDWDSRLNKFKSSGAADADVTLGRGGLAYGNRYFQLAPRPEHKIAQDQGKTPVGIYGGLSSVNHSSGDLRCVTDRGSEYFNQLISKNTNIGKSSFDELRYPNSLLLRYPATFTSPLEDRNASCLMIHPIGNKSCSSRGCISMAPKEFETLNAWVNPQRKPAIAILPKTEVKNLSNCLPGVASENSQSNSNKSKSDKRARQ